MSLPNCWNLSDLKKPNWTNSNGSMTVTMKPNYSTSCEKNFGCCSNAMMSCGSMTLNWKNWSDYSIANCYGCSIVTNLNENLNCDSNLNGSTIQNWTNCCGCSIPNYCCLSDCLIPNCCCSNGCCSKENLNWNCDSMNCENLKLKNWRSYGSTNCAKMNYGCSKNANCLQMNCSNYASLIPNCCSMNATMTLSYCSMNVTNFENLNYAMSLNDCLISNCWMSYATNSNVTNSNANYLNDWTKSSWTNLNDWTKPKNCCSNGWMIPSCLNLNDCSKNGSTNCDLTKRTNCWNCDYWIQSYLTNCDSNLNGWTNCGSMKQNCWSLSDYLKRNCCCLNENWTVTNCCGCLSCDCSNYENSKPTNYCSNVTSCCDSTIPNYWTNYEMNSNASCSNDWNYYGWTKPNWTNLSDCYYYANLNCGCWNCASLNRQMPPTINQFLMKYQLLPLNCLMNYGCWKLNWKNSNANLIGNSNYGSMNYETSLLSWSWSCDYLSYGCSNCENSKPMSYCSNANWKPNCWNLNAMTIPNCSMTNGSTTQKNCWSYDWTIATNCCGCLNCDCSMNENLKPSCWNWSDCCLNVTTNCGSMSYDWN